MPKPMTTTGWRVRRSHEPKRMAERQLSLAYDALLSTMNTPPPANNIPPFRPPQLLPLVGSDQAIEASAKLCA